MEKEEIIKDWLGFISSSSFVNSPLFKNKEILDHMCLFSYKKYNEKLTHSILQHMMPLNFTNPMKALDYYHMKSNYNFIILGELRVIVHFIMDQIELETKRLEGECKKHMNVKVTDRIYNPVHNKMGYILENGDVVFTDEVVTNSTFDIESVSLLRKLNIGSILSE